ncbi:MAG: hypothetical protein IID15_05940 [Candidatus Marinimicrobia bacterium]|nr:hypothetical protein [Candidatus Neomarinimicrobiota bacterium]
MSDIKTTNIPMLVLLLTLVPELCAGQWSETAEVRNREGVVVSYRAMLDGNMLVIEATHAPDWHTYAMDNIQRAREESGRDRPETELPTRIELAGGLRIVGNWFQSRPKNLSQMEIRWYTWGFEEVVQFLAQVERVDGADALISINGQACNAAMCSYIGDLPISLSLPSGEDFSAGAARTSIDLSQFVEVANQPAENKVP